MQSHGPDVTFGVAAWISSRTQAGLGDIAAGMLRHFDQIDASVEQRKEFIGNLAGFASDLTGLAPGWGQALGPVFSALNTIYQSMDQPPNDQEVAYELVGKVRGAWLEGKRPEGWTRDDVRDAIDWVETALNLNGLFS